MPFQTAINDDLAPGVAGDFASANPWSSVLAGPGAFIAGANGLQAGLFAWIDADGVRVNNTGTGAPAGFVHRSYQALITTYLAESGNVIQPGQAVTLHDGGDFWAITTTVATRGQKVFARLTDGAIGTGAPGATVAGYAETRFWVGQVSPSPNPGAIGQIIKITHRVTG